MNRYCLSWALVVFAFLAQQVSACEIVIPPLRNEFRQARAVFIGKVKRVQDFTPSPQESLNVPEPWRAYKTLARIHFEISKKWKGPGSREQEYVAIAHLPCGCPGDPWRQFSEGDEYLIFEYDKGFLTVCESDKIGPGHVQDKVKRLNSFWFRAWARIYPF